MTLPLFPARLPQNFSFGPSNLTSCSNTLFIPLDLLSYYHYVLFFTFTLLIVTIFIRSITSNTTQLHLPFVCSKTTCQSGIPRHQHNLQPAYFRIINCFGTIRCFDYSSQEFISPEDLVTSKKTIPRRSTLPDQKP